MYVIATHPFLTNEEAQEELIECYSPGWKVYEVKEDKNMNVTSRYEALGMDLPDPKTMCKGQCEGTGLVPVSKSDMEEPFHTLWLKAEEEKPTDDGYHFVKCPDCKGTGKASSV